MSHLATLIDCDRIIMTSLERLRYELNTATDGSQITACQGEIRFTEGTLSSLRSRIDIMVHEAGTKAAKATTSVHEAARRLGVSKRWLKSQIEAGLLPGLLAEKDALVHFETIDAILADRAKRVCVPECATAEGVVS